MCLAFCLISWGFNTPQENEREPSQATSGENYFRNRNEFSARFSLPCTSRQSSFVNSVAGGSKVCALAVARLMPN